ncbi:hypothetical protein RISK_000854 [Rhodopirellula islandica]|uniref:Uncharacterized protein n=1 Tax=Rhodopirellula islandica TaxID=595434 RepID=A0A0J1BKU4_RHOIS|nr:hypothetical protein RISK_000854 [Rhodopirellula islandica]
MRVTPDNVAAESPAIVSAVGIDHEVSCQAAAQPLKQVGRNDQAQPCEPFGR